MGVGIGWIKPETYTGKLIWICGKEHFWPPERFRFLFGWLWRENRWLRLQKAMCASRNEILSRNGPDLKINRKQYSSALARKSCGAGDPSRHLDYQYLIEVYFVVFWGLKCIAMFIPVPKTAWKRRKSLFRTKIRFGNVIFQTSGPEATRSHVYQDLLFIRARIYFRKYNTRSFHTGTEPLRSAQPLRSGDQIK